MSKIIAKNIYILRKDLRIHERYLENSKFFYFWNEDNFEKEKRGKRYKDFIKKELLKLKKKFPQKVLIEENHFLLASPGEILKEDGKPYVVFTPFYKKWQKVVFNKKISIQMIKISWKNIKNFLIKKLKVMEKTGITPGKKEHHIFPDI